MVKGCSNGARRAATDRLIAGIVARGPLRVETVRAKAKKAKPARERKTALERSAPRLRIVMGEGLILGPGKVDLIEAIERKGSISAASREMGMSYRRAWLLVDALNTMFGRPIVTAA